MKDLYVCNKFKMLPNLFSITAIFSIAFVFLFFFMKLASYSVGSYLAYGYGVAEMSRWFYKKFRLKFKLVKEGLMYTYSNKWDTISWDSIGRIEYKKGIITGTFYEQANLYLRDDRIIPIGARTKQYLELWQIIYKCLNEYSSNVIIDPNFVQRLQSIV